jgi:hypothetical protein
MQPCGVGGCVRKFGKTKDLVVHQRQEHGVRLATQEDTDEALRLARDLVNEIINNDAVMMYMNFVDHCLGTDPQQYLSAKLYDFLNNHDCSNSGVLS